MKDQTITRMANQIAAFFEPYPHEEAVAGVADHMKSFWEPRMQAHLFDLLDRGGEGLEPLAKEAADQLHEASKAELDAESPADNKFGGGEETHGN